MKKLMLAIIFMLPLTIGFAQEFKISDLFVSGTLNTHTFRIPALEVSTRGTVIAICDARRDNGSDLPGNIDLIMRRSFDHGETWEPAKVILDFKEKHGCGDPSLVVDRIIGRIFCFYAYAPPGISIHKAKPGSNSADDPTSQHVQYIYSDDEGESWSEPVELNPSVKAPEWEGLFASSGHGIQTRSGRLMQPLVIKYDMKGDGSFQTHARNAYSDDHGKTWKVSEPAGIQVGETKVVELPDGTVMQNMRNRNKLYRSVSVSDNDGDSFGEMWQDSALIGPRCNASITRYSSIWEGHPYNIMAFSNPASQKGRKNMTIRLSFDNTQTWPVSIPVYEGPSAYSSLVRLYDGGLGLLFETGKKSPYEKISFVKIEKEELDRIINEYVTDKGLKRPGFTPYYYHSSHQFGLLPDTENEIIFMGNSITDGGEWFELFGDERMKNRGISGDITDGVLLRLQDITRVKPAKLFLLIGINDLARKRTTLQVIENHKKIYEQIRKESPNTQLYVQSILPVNNYFGKFGGHTSKADSVEIINRVLKEIAEEMGHTYIDVASAMKDNEGKLRRDLTEDGLHLNGRGYQVWTEVIRDYVNTPETKKDKILKVVCFGNSTTAYRRTIDQVFSERLPGMLMKAGIPAVVYNEGIPGSHTGRRIDNDRFKIPHGTDRFEKAVLGHDPEIVTICFGLNDSWFDKGKDQPRISLDQYRSNLKKMIDELKKRDIKIILMTPNAIGKKFKKWRYKYTAQYAEAMRSLANEYELPLIDQWKLFEEYAAEKGNKIDNLMLDGMHPNDQWHAQWAGLIVKEIEQIINTEK